MNNPVGSSNTYPLNSDLSSRKCYPTFEQPGTLGFTDVLYNIKGSFCRFLTVEVNCFFYVDLFVSLEELTQDRVKWATETGNLFCNIAATNHLKVAKSCCGKYRVVLLFATMSCGAFYRPEANLFWSKWSNSHVWPNSRVISSSQMPLFTQLAAT